MKKINILLLLFFTCVVQSILFSQTFDPKKVVKWTERHAIPANVKIGDIITLNFSCVIDHGYHLYAAQQPSKAALPLKLIFREAEGVESIGNTEDGPGKIVEMDDVFGEEVAFYEKTASFSQKVKITSSKPKLVGRLSCQVCTDEFCLPYEYDFNIPLKVGGAATSTPPAVTTPAAVTVTSPKTTATTTTPSTSKPTSPASIKADTVLPTENPRADLSVLNGVHWQAKVTPDGSKKPNIGDKIILSFKGILEPGVRLLGVSPQKDGTSAMPAFELSPTSVGLEEVGQVEIKGNKKSEKDKATKTDIIYYEDSVELLQELKVTGENPMLAGFMTYPAAEKGQRVIAKQEIQPAFTWVNTISPTETKIEAPETENKSIWGRILKGLAFGIGAILTPCFYPLIPLTVSFFTKKSGSRARGIFNALFYGFSIIAIFSVVALALSWIFGPTVLNRVATDPYVNIFLFALIFAFGLSFLGWFDIALPSSLTTAISKKSNTSSLSGIFFMALTLVVVSFSCTGQFVAEIMKSIGDDSDASLLYSILPMIAFSAALAFPFMLLALFPSLLQSIPRSGSWLGTFKVVLGFLELALAFSYLSNADLVMHWNLIPREIFVPIWVAIAFVTGYYLLGRLYIQKNDIPEAGITVPRLLFALLFFAVGVYMIPGMFNKPLSIFDSILPPINVSAAEHKQNGQHSASPSAEICNYPNKKYNYLSEHTPVGLCAFYDLEQGLEYAKAKNKPVLLDFTGHTCKNCRKVEQNIWVDPEITKILQKDFVLISLYTDDRVDLSGIEVTASGKKLYNVGEKWLDYSDRVYGVSAQPYYVLMDHDKSNLITPFGYQDAPDIQTYKKNLQAGLAEFKKRKGL